MHGVWTDRFSDYLDNDLPPEERAVVDAHLAGCEECRTVIADLRAVTLAARSHAGAAPPKDLWPLIAARIAPPVPNRAWSMSWAAAIAAGLFIALASSLGIWAVLNRSAFPAEETLTSVGQAPEVSSISHVSYDAAVNDLLDVLETRRERLDPRTVEVLERNIAIIDTAIAEARAAVEQDPGDRALASHLVRQQRTKLAVLRQAGKLTVDAP